MEVRRRNKTVWQGDDGLVIVLKYRKKCVILYGKNKI